MKRGEAVARLKVSLQIILVTLNRKERSHLLPATASALCKSSAKLTVIANLIFYPEALSLISLLTIPRRVSFQGYFSLSRGHRNLNMKTLHHTLQTLFTLTILVLAANSVFSQNIGGNGHKQGSVLFYNVYTSSVGSPDQQNTRLNITNTAFSPVIVHWFFVDSGTCAIADTYTCLTGNQTYSFLASDYDPGVTGYAVAVAVNGQGMPIDFDSLIGTEYIKFASGHQANLPAEALVLVNPAAAVFQVADSGGTLVDLVFDGAGYERLPSDLALDNIPSLVDSNNTMLILNRIGGNLGELTSNIGTLGGLLYNDVEKGFSFSIRTSGCQVRTTLNDAFLRTSPPLSKVIGTGSSGWIRLFTVEKVDNSPQGGTTDARAILGAMINFNPNAQTTGQGFNQGHNLHHLIYAPSAKLRMPVIVPPTC